MNTNKKKILIGVIILVIILIIIGVTLIIFTRQTIENNKKENIIFNDIQQSQISSNNIGNIENSIEDNELESSKDVTNKENIISRESTIDKEKKTNSNNEKKINNKTKDSKNNKTTTNTNKNNSIEKSEEQEEKNIEEKQENQANSQLANTYFSKYNSSKTKKAVDYINSKMKEDEMYNELGGYAISVSSKPTDYWFSYSSNSKLDGLALAGCVVKVYVEDYYKYNSKGTNYYLYDTKVYAYQQVLK